MQAAPVTQRASRRPRGAQPIARPLLRARHWPPCCAAGPDGSPCFCYTWSPNYAAAQRVFEAAQASYDPNAVGAVLQQFPYHVDSLLAMNDLYRSMGEAQVRAMRARAHLNCRVRATLRTHSLLRDWLVRGASAVLARAGARTR